MADALGATLMPWAPNMRHIPAVRRSCQPMPGPTGTPVTASQTMVDARWLAIPTLEMGPHSARVRSARVTTIEAMAAASNSTAPCQGVLGSIR